MTRSIKTDLIGTCVGLGLAALLFASPGLAQRSSPFASLSGSWSGSGTISLNTGAKERIRCRAQYRTPTQSGGMHLDLRCASDSYKFELQSDLSHNDGAISGTWSEATRGAAGSITGTSAGGQMNLRATSPVFSASLAVHTRSNQQTISIQSPGSEIAAVAINLSRGGR